MNRWVLWLPTPAIGTATRSTRSRAIAELADLLVATARKLPKSVPDPLPEPDITAYEETAAAHDAELDQEHARRVAVDEHASHQR